jgi:hypothetical protein
MPRFCGFKNVVTKIIENDAHLCSIAGMASREGAVHVVTTRRDYKGRTYETHLLRRSYRDEGKVKNETVGNLSHLPAHVIELVRRALKGETFGPSAETFEITSSTPHGDAMAIAIAMRKLGFAQLLSSRPCREAKLVTAMVAARIIAPHTKLATTRWWHTHTLAEDLGVANADEDDLYHAMDWLLEQQPTIEKKLAARHLDDDSLVLYDLSSSYFEGTSCPLAKFGYNRDGTGHKLQVNYGILTTSRGCPVATSVYEGNTNDAKTLVPQVRKLKDNRHQATRARRRSRHDLAESDRRDQRRRRARLDHGAQERSNPSVAR